MENFDSSYLEKAWGDSVDNSVTFEDVLIAIKETIAMDEEHGAFWVGIIVKDEEYVLETDRGLNVTGVFSGNVYKKNFSEWKQIEGLYQLFLNLNHKAVIAMLTSANG